MGRRSICARGKHYGTTFVSSYVSTVFAELPLRGRWLRSGTTTHVLGHEVCSIVTLTLHFSWCIAAWSSICSGTSQNDQLRRFLIRKLQWSSSGTTSWCSYEDTNFPATIQARESSSQALWPSQLPSSTWGQESWAPYECRLAATQVPPYEAPSRQMRRLSREAPVSTATKELTAHIVLGALLLGGSGQTAFNRVIHQVYCFPVPDSSPDIDCSDAAIGRGGKWQLQAIVVVPSCIDTWFRRDVSMICCLQLELFARANCSLYVCFKLNDRNGPGPFLWLYQNKDLTIAVEAAELQELFFDRLDFLTSSSLFITSLQVERVPREQGAVFIDDNNWKIGCSIIVIDAYVKNNTLRLQYTAVLDFHYLKPLTEPKYHFVRSKHVLPALRAGNDYLSYTTPNSHHNSESLRSPRFAPPVVSIAFFSLVEKGYRW